MNKEGMGLEKNLRHSISGKGFACAQYIKDLQNQGDKHQVQKSWQCCRAARIHAAGRSECTMLQLHRNTLWPVLLKLNIFVPIPIILVLHI